MDAMTEKLAEQVAELKAEKAELERDCVILASRLYLDDDGTMAPETVRVMQKMRPKVDAILKAVA